MTDRIHHKDRPDLLDLIERAKAIPFTTEMREQQRESWVVGELMLENPSMTEERARALYRQVRQEPAMTEQEIEERVARALCLARGGDPDYLVNHRPLWWAFRDEARIHIAAIRAYRESIKSEKGHD